MVNFSVDSPKTAAAHTYILFTNNFIPGRILTAFGAGNLRMKMKKTADLYRSLYARSRNSWHKEMMHQALLEVERIKNSFPENKGAMAS